MTSVERLALRPNSPLRRPGWRWELARHLRGSPRAVNTQNDPHVSDAMALQDLLEGTTADADLGDAYLTSGDAADAYLFWSSGLVAETPSGIATDGGPLSPQALARAELEALVLANRPAARIAKITGLSEAAVEIYERWFFDVRDRLKRPGWISANVIGSLFDNSPLALLPNLIRAYGYYTQSVRVIRTIVGGFDQAIARRAGRDPGRFFGADALTAGSLKAALAVRMLNLTDARSFGRIIELHHEAADLEAKLAAGGGGSEDQDKFKAAFQAICGNMDARYHEAPVDTHSAGPRLVQIDADDAAG